MANFGSETCKKCDENFEYILGKFRGNFVKNLQKYGNLEEIFRKFLKIFDQFFVQFVKFSATDVHKNFVKF